MGKYDAQDIADGAAWEGHADNFLQAMVTAGFIGSEKAFILFTTGGSMQAGCWSAAGNMQQEREEKDVYGKHPLDIQRAAHRIHSNSNEPRPYSTDLDKDISRADA